MALAREHLLDELATAYVQTMAALGGTTIAVSRLDYGVDGTLKQIVRVRNRHVETGFPVDFQLKGTTVAKIDNERVIYDLNARNYDLIAERERDGTPYYLFLVCFDADPTRWVSDEPGQLIFRASAFFWTVAGPPTKNSSSVRISIGTKDRLTPDAIAFMLEESRERFVND